MNIYLGSGISVRNFQQNSDSQNEIDDDDDSNETFYTAKSDISYENHNDPEDEDIPPSIINDENYENPVPSSSRGNMVISDSDDSDFEESIIQKEIPETDFIQNTLLQSGKGLESKISFKLKEIAFKRYKKLPLYCKHFKLLVSEPKKSSGKFDQPLISEIYSQFFLAFHDAITKLKNEYPDRGFWIKLILPGNNRFIDKGLILPEEKTEDIINFYKQSLERAITSNNSLKLDKTFEVFFHIMVLFM